MDRLDLRHLALRLALGLAFTACGGASSGGATTPSGPPDVAGLYPLAEGNVWSYDAVSDAGNHLSILRVTSVAGDRITLESDRVPFVYERRPEGLFFPGANVWVLKAPLAVGARWPSRSGRTARIAAMDLSVEVRAGTFTRCVRVEEDGGPQGLRIATTYCPGVGPVRIESELATELTGETVRVVAELLGHQLTDP
ncbi:MAG: hypothetical protein AAF447_18300 [Myxococcota bacterium]